jgi:hypothetical protein
LKPATGSPPRSTRPVGRVNLKSACFLLLHHRDDFACGEWAKALKLRVAHRATSRIVREAICMRELQQHGFEAAQTGKSRAAIVGG